MTKTEEQKKVKLQSINEKVKSTMTSEINQIEEWTQLTFKEIIFDSNINSWEPNNSEFDTIVLNKQNLIFLFEDTENNLFGYIHSAKITNIRKVENMILTRNKNLDLLSFVFSLKSNGRLEQPTKFPFKKECFQHGLQVFGEECCELVVIGGGDIFIMTSCITDTCLC